MTLTKSKIVEKISKQGGYSRKQSIALVDSILGTIKKTLVTGEDVLISGFGKFCVKDKKQRRGRNPATGNDMMLRPRRVVTFKCSGVLRNRVNGR